MVDRVLLRYSIFFVSFDALFDKETIAFKLRILKHDKKPQETF